MRPRRSVLSKVILSTTAVAGGAGIGTYYCWTHPEYHPFLAARLEQIPYRAISRAWGDLHSKELPTWARSPLYRTWGFVFNSDLSEADQDDLSKYKNLSEFFTRKLKPGVRPIDKNYSIVCPVDGTVVNFGKVEADGTLEQIKGQSYHVQDFLGHKPSVSTGKNLYYCTVYLAPGDYHRIHASTSWDINRCAHFGGYLFPVAPAVVKVVPKLFAVNERVVLAGSWKDGYYSLTAVGATNVGSIELCGDLAPTFKIKTNSSADDESFFNKKPIKNEFSLSAPMKVKPEDEVALFNLGSTIVLVFEGKPEFKFNLREGQKIKMGTGIGN
jgi:phosphatidylserine decarboxylase